MLTFESSDTEGAASSVVPLPIFCLRYSDSLNRHEFDFRSLIFSCLYTTNIVISNLVGDFLYRSLYVQYISLPEDEPPGSKHVEYVKN